MKPHIHQRTSATWVHVLLARWSRGGRGLGCPRLSDLDIVIVIVIVIGIGIGIGIVIVIVIVIVTMKATKPIDPCLRL